MHFEDVYFYLLVFHGHCLILSQSRILTRVNHTQLRVSSRIYSVLPPLAI
jgi:hypothetical protein